MGIRIRSNEGRRTARWSGALGQDAYGTFGACGGRCMSRAAARTVRGRDHARYCTPVDRAVASDVWYDHARYEGAGHLLSRIRRTRSVRRGIRRSRGLPGRRSAAGTLSGSRPTPSAAAGSNHFVPTSAQRRACVWPPMDHVAARPGHPARDVSRKRAVAHGRLTARGDRSKRHASAYRRADCRRGAPCTGSEPVRPGGGCRANRIRSSGARAPGRPRRHHPARRGRRQVTPGTPGGPRAGQAGGRLGTGLGSPAAGTRLATAPLRPQRGVTWPCGARPPSLQTDVRRICVRRACGLPGPTGGGAPGRRRWRASAPPAPDGEIIKGMQAAGPSAVGNDGRPARAGRGPDAESSSKTVPDSGGTHTGMAGRPARGPQPPQYTKTHAGRGRYAIRACQNGHDPSRNATDVRGGARHGGERRPRPGACGDMAVGRTRVRRQAGRQASRGQKGGYAAGRGPGQ